MGPDAAAYLRLARHLAAGGGLDLPAATTSGVARFATWPPGYPALIALPTALGVDPWWAARAVNGACLLGTVALWRRLAPDAALEATLALGAASVLYVFGWTASEAPLVLALTALAATLVALDARPGTTVPAAFAATGAFAVRYVGLVTVPVLVVAALVARRRRGPRLTVGLLAAAALPAVVAGALLTSNRAATGHLTGLPRLPAPEGVVGLATMTTKALLAEVLLPVPWLSSRPGWVFVTLAAALLQAGVAVAVLRAPDLAPRFARPAVVVPAAVGLAYAAAVVTMRWTWHFDVLGWRLLGPATALVLPSLVVALSTSGPIARRRLRRGLGALAAASVVVVLGDAALEPGDAATTRAAVLARYADVPPGCVVGPHDTSLPWLRPDLVPAMPAFTPYDTVQESVDAFRDRLVATPFDCVRIEVRHDLDPDRFDLSWAALALDHPDGAFLGAR